MTKRSCMNEDKICIRAGATIVRRDVEPARDFVTGFDLAQDPRKMVQIVTKRSEGGPTRWWLLPPTPKEFICSDSKHASRIPGPTNTNQIPTRFSATHCVVL